MRQMTMDRRSLQTLLIAVFALVGLSALALGTFNHVDGADHIDSMNAAADQPADIADVFAFQRNGNVVLALTLSGVQTPDDLLLGESLFDPRVLYEFRIDTDGDAVANQVIQAFALGNARNQQMRIVGPTAPEMTGTSARIVNGPSLKVRVSTDGNIGRKNVGERDGVKAFAGVREDPFYFDFTRFNQILAGEATSFRSEENAVDAFADLNVYALVVEFPIEKLGPGVTPDDVGVWATTSR